MKIRSRPWLGRALVLVSCSGIYAAGLVPSTTSKAVGQGPPPPPPQGNQATPLPGITKAEKALFDEGLADFLAIEAPEDGLGPVFNGVACAECHRAGGLGGAATNLRVALVTRIGGISKGVYSDLPELGGPVLQARSLREFLGTYPIPGERVPREAQFVSRRQTTPLFGAGLIEAIPDQAILANERRTWPDGVHGVANRVTNPDTKRVEIGRFGWKAQASTLHWFAGDAYLNEMGITNHTFAKENLPQGKAIPNGADIVPDPEETGTGVEVLEGFMKYLAPPKPENPTAAAILGARVFEQVRCSSCHIPSMQTGRNASRALSNQTVRLYSDLLLHKMGTELADGIQQGKSTGDQFKTAPLWGLGDRPFYLHDGRATTIEDAVKFHGGEAAIVRDRYNRLSTRERNALNEFLRSL